MSTEVVMPQMGESIAEGTITKWLKKVGERVDRDENAHEQGEAGSRHAHMIATIPDPDVRNG